MIKAGINKGLFKY